jgi:hypothetical protein
MLTVLVFSLADDFPVLASEVYIVISTGHSIFMPTDNKQKNPMRRERHHYANLACGRV